MTEKELFETLKKTIPDLEKTKSQFSRHDCISDLDELVIELKCRKKHYPTMLIEKKKYDHLLAKAEELRYTPLYINSTPEGIFVWYLKDLKIDFKLETKHPATTHFGYTQRVPKEVGYLSIEDAERLEL